MIINISCKVSCVGQLVDKDFCRIADASEVAMSQPPYILNCYNTIASNTTATTTANATNSGPCFSLRETLFLVKGYVRLIH